jgi:hypothetical protein
MPELEHPKLPERLELPIHFRPIGLIIIASLILIGAFEGITYVELDELRELVHNIQIREKG